MGRYAELVLNCILKPNIPEQVIKTLEYMLDKQHATGFEDFPDHQFFKNPDWQDLLITQHSATLGKACSHFYSDDGGLNNYHLIVRCNIKANSGYRYFEEFLEWVAQYNYFDNFVGYIHDHNADEPILIYFEGGEVFLRKVGKSRFHEISDSW